MNLATLRASLIEHEGQRDTPYQDKRGNWTVGIGHLMSNPLSQEAIDQILDDDISAAIQNLNLLFPRWRNHNDARQNVLAEMMFNLGPGNLKGFKKMWAALALKDYDRAALEMMASAWAIQVGKRARTLSSRMKNG